MIKISYDIPKNLSNVSFAVPVKNACNKWGFQVVNKIKLDASGKKLNVVSGRLRNSIKHEVSQTKTKTKIKIGSWKIPYAEIHDMKGLTEITPKSKQFLTLPFDESIKGNSRQFNNTFIVRTKKGNLIVAQEIAKKIKGRDIPFKPLFLLKKKVYIRGTGYITDNVRDNIMNLERMIQHEVNAFALGFR